VHTWTDVEPSAMNSAASRQVEIPPMPRDGHAIPGRALAATMWSAMGFTAGPQ
jgi:hypothetical protein